MRLERATQRAKGESNLNNCIRCEVCKSEVEYLISEAETRTPCIPCPTDKAVCFGGNEIGPRKGFWRESALSDDFLRCFSKEACL